MGCLPSVVIGAILLLMACAKCEVSSTDTRTSTSATLPKPDAEQKNILPDVLVSVAEYETAQATKRLPGSLASSVCYEDLGCFSRMGNFSDYLKLPITPEKMATEFHLFTEAHQTQPDFLDYGNPTSIKASKFRKGEPVIIVVHGFGDSANASWYTDFQIAVLGKYPLANFIAVDWAAGAAAPKYWTAAVNTQMAGAQIARLLSVLNNVTGTKMSDVHLIGFSLGAHVVGSTARKLTEFGLQRVGRITGLDPAGPLFRNFHPWCRLDVEDADFVQIIHSNAGTSLNGDMGIDMQLGHRDFYPNGGHAQPGCTSGLHSTFHNMVRNANNCNHNRAPAYVSEAILSSCPFTGYACDSYEKFISGECSDAKHVKMDIFTKDKTPIAQPIYFQTHADGSFCAHTFRLSVTISGKSSPRKGSLKLTLKPKASALKNATTSTITVLKQTNFKPGQTHQDVLISRAALPELEEITVEYERACLILCRDNTNLEVASIKIQELGSAITAECKNLRLANAVAVKVVSSNGQSSCGQLL
ncbi:Pancreatic lipase-related protein 2 [Hypsibius exemplaris]|uniref:Pancreatic lipase-related protein 2 n=1 Tax=Hypsibius exemplaris TaxID=2072580 RepID=A0A1W0XBJ5_HYPEX|nr:Pancreatic lipase-related protein 2 [Hypsibius exemplaris]